MSNSDRTIFGIWTGLVLFILSIISATLFYFDIFTSRDFFSATCFVQELILPNSSYEANYSIEMLKERYERPLPWCDNPSSTCIRALKYYILLSSTAFALFYFAIPFLVDRYANKNIYKTAGMGSMLFIGNIIILSIILAHTLFIGLGQIFI